jgi:hypothetical protein
MMTDKILRKMVDRKLNEVIAEIQKSIGVESGDEAAWYFSGDRFDDMLDEVTEALVAYRDHENQMQEPLVLTE